MRGQACGAASRGHEVRSDARRGSRAASENWRTAWTPREPGGARPTPGRGAPGDWRLHAFSADAATMSSESRASRLYEAVTVRSRWIGAVPGLATCAEGPSIRRCVFYGGEQGLDGRDVERFAIHLDPRAAGLTKDADRQQEADGDLHHRQAEGHRAHARFGQELVGAPRPFRRHRDREASPRRQPATRRRARRGSRRAATASRCDRHHALGSPTCPPRRPGPGASSHRCCQPIPVHDRGVMPSQCPRQVDRNVPPAP
jgi:hypothetical protein